MALQRGPDRILLCPPGGGPPERSEGEEGRRNWREPRPPSVTGSTFPRREGESLCPPGGGTPERSEGEEGTPESLSNPVPTSHLPPPPGEESSQIEAEVDHVAFGDEIVLSLQAQQTGIFCPLLPTVLDEILIGDHLGPNETPLKIGVD